MKESKLASARITVAFFSFSSFFACTTLCNRQSFLFNIWKTQISGGEDWSQGLRVILPRAMQSRTAHTKGVIFHRILDMYLQRRYHKHKQDALQHNYRQAKKYIFLVYILGALSKCKEQKLKVFTCINPCKANILRDPNTNYWKEIQWSSFCITDRIENNWLL